MLPKHDMDRAPSLASGMGSRPFEWTSTPAQRTQSTASRSSAADNITFAPSNSPRASDNQLSTSNRSSTATSRLYIPTPFEQDMGDTDMAESAEAEENSNEDPTFPPLHGSPPRLPPIRLTPEGHGPLHAHEVRSEHRPPTQPPPPTSFPAEAVAERHGVTPEDIVQVSHAMRMDISLLIGYTLSSRYG